MYSQLKMMTLKLVYGMKKTNPGQMILLKNLHGINQKDNLILVQESLLQLLTYKRKH